MTINRRRFIAASAAGAGLSSLPFSTLAEVMSKENNTSWAELFREEKLKKPWLSAYQSVERETFNSRAQITGKWPKDLMGSLYRNGPARHEIGGFRYQHWFDGDGMLQAFRMTPKGVFHQAKMIQTSKYKAEKAAGRALYPGFATVPPNPAPVTSPDLVNSGNISVLPHNGKLLALWEAGSPWDMDPETLETKGLHSFSAETKGVPFSAHPRVEADGTLWNFGYASSAKLIVLWHIDSSGKLVKVGTVSSDPISMPHDFIVTSKHIVLMMPPLNYNRVTTSSFLDAHHWQADQPTRLLVVDKNDFSKYKWLELPSQWVFHFGNGWEDKNGIIRFDGARSADPMNMIRSFRNIMRGAVSADTATLHHQYRIDTKNWTASEEPLFSSDIQTEFPVIDPRVSCVQNRRLVMLSSNDRTPAGHPNHNEVSTFDIESGKRDVYRYPDSQIPEEHLFVAKPGSAPETKGWVLGTAHDWHRQLTLLNVFDVEAVSAGPIATATLPYALPLGLHGKFVAS
jgi:all-trans-8'-apo-beta-carotenal 15,15'-oxygenase